MPSEIDNRHQETSEVNKRNSDLVISDYIKYDIDNFKFLPMPITFIVSLCIGDNEENFYKNYDKKFFIEQIYRKASELKLFSWFPPERRYESVHRELMIPLIADTLRDLTFYSLHGFYSSIVKKFQTDSDFSIYPRFGFMTDKIKDPKPRLSQMPEYLNLFQEKKKALIKDRNVNVINLGFSLTNISEEEMNLIKEIRIDVETDRGDSKTLIFDNFQESGNIYKDSYHPFKIDSSYRTQPVIGLLIRSCDVIYIEKVNIPEKLKWFKAMLNSIKNEEAIIYIKGKLGRFIEETMPTIIFLSFFSAVTGILANLIKDFSFWIQIIGYGLILLALLGVIIHNFTRSKTFLKMQLWWLRRGR